jgi:hypothetical protein
VSFSACGGFAQVPNRGGWPWGGEWKPVKLFPWNRLQRRDCSRLHFCSKEPSRRNRGCEVRTEACSAPAAFKKIALVGAWGGGGPFVWRRVQRPLREIFAQWSVKVADAALVRWVRALSIVALAFGGAGRRHDLYIWRQGDDRAGGDSARLVLIASDGCSRPVCICMGSCLASLYLINHYNLASPPP